MTLLDRCGRRRELAAAVVLLWSLLYLTPPAAAHVSGGTTSNFRSFFTNNGADCLAWSMLSGDGYTRLRSSCASTVTVLGYEGEPYLQFSPDFGVRENRNSPATYLNEDAQADVDVPPGVTPDAPPDWEPRAGLTSTIWHDHRTHWMANTPPQTRERSTRISSWAIPMQFDDDGTGQFTYRIDATGELWYDRPATAWWSIALATSLGGVALAIGIRRNARSSESGTWNPADSQLACTIGWFVAGAGVLTACAVLDDLALAGQTSSDRRADLLLAAAALGVTMWAVWRSRRGGTTALTALAVAAATLVSAYGWPNRSQLSAAHLLGRLPDPMIRLSTAMQFTALAVTLIGSLSDRLPRTRSGRTAAR